MIGVVGLEGYGTRGPASARWRLPAPGKEAAGAGFRHLLAHANGAARQRVQRRRCTCSTLAACAEVSSLIRGLRSAFRAKAAPPVLRQDPTEFAALCPASAVCMTQALTTPNWPPP